ncbi:MAG: hypothetical protein HFH31_00190 [Bacilli bacterium]|nr:hypothetical protein [Bacilli bacterium]
MNLINFTNVLDDYVCSDLFSPGLPGQLASIIHTAITVIKIVVPILLIIWGMLDLGKAVMAQKEDEIKKGQQTFIKRIVAAAIVFFIVTIVQLVMGLVAGDEGIWTCVDAIINYSA